MSNTKPLTHVVGTFLISGKGAFLNSPGTVDGVTVPKTYYTLDERGKQTKIPYVSAQAWKRWLRETYKEENPNEPKSIIKVLQVDERKHTPSKIGTDMDPIIFAEDDIFGYMKTLKKQEEESEDETEKVEEKANVNNDDITAKPVIRTSPFQASILTSIRKISARTEDIGWVRPGGASDDIIDKNIEYTTDSLGYTTEFYDTHLQGIFGLAYHRLGVFRNEGDRIELDITLEKQYLKEKKIEKLPDVGTRRIYKLVDNHRKDRATKILKALSVMRGGAKQTAFADPVHPQIILLAGLSCGNLIFNNLFKDTVEGPEINITALNEIIKDFSDRVVSTVYIGIRAGYLNSANEEELKGKTDWVKTVKVVTPIEAVNQFVNELPE
ncbi:MAG: DevR family CRISPR-associated autoregulator [Bacteroidota bacterium]|nr:DevR family CRISPR-associated autoregulator [Bacteroidota bacterium]